jgi:hypothetical protein
VADATAATDDAKTASGRLVAVVVVVVVMAEV